uniref:Inositol hexakisphosphate and diphosphoinositol-pentakisphosphate kinase n=1 Tax=Lygus hesperus TaxID=30085 RepID=A0A0A9ZD47_LYGHE
MIAAGESYSYGKHKVKSGRDSFSVPRTNNIDFCDSSAIEHFSESSLCAGLNDISINAKSRLPNDKEGFKPAKTPDNKDVPNKRELSFAGWSDESPKDVELGGSYNPNSFLQSSDSLDNNCILNGESVGAELYDDTLDEFEGETVARFRNDLFFSSMSGQEKLDGVKDYVSAMLTSAVRSAKFQDHSEMLVNKDENRSYTGYYSEYFDVHKPVYNKRLVEVNSRMVEVPWSESRRESEKLKRSQTVDLWRKSLRKKDISKLIHYFESGVSKGDGPSRIGRAANTKLKIFEEVSEVREKERSRRDHYRSLKRESQASNLELGLVSPSSSQSATSLNIITPPLGFQNSFPLGISTDHDVTKAIEDADVFSHVSVSGVCNRLSSQEINYEGQAVCQSHPFSKSVIVRTIIMCFHLPNFSFFLDLPPRKFSSSDF